VTEPQPGDVDAHVAHARGRPPEAESQDFTHLWAQGNPSRARRARGPVRPPRSDWRGRPIFGCVLIPARRSVFVRTKRPPRYPTQRASTTYARNPRAAIQTFHNCLRGYLQSAQRPCTYERTGALYTVARKSRSVRRLGVAAPTAGPEGPKADDEEGWSVWFCLYWMKSTLHTAAPSLQVQESSRKSGSSAELGPPRRSRTTRFCRAVDVS